MQSTTLPDMDKRQEYIQKIDAIPTVSFNKEQKEIAKKIIAQTDDADLSAVFGLITQRVKTGFVFDEAPEVNHNAVALAVEKPDLNIGVSGLETMEGKTEHTLIIGENYDALKNLCATYIDKNGRGLIDVIYIDPPYNTEACKADGNDYKDEVQATKFIYRDKFTRDGWLNMMNERLKLARRLLSDKGVIFISIDDSEQAYLKVLCDEIFGEENFVATFLWNKTQTPPSASNKTRKTHEYILCYQKQKDNSRMIARFSSDGDAPLWNETNSLRDLLFPANYVHTSLKDGIYKKGVRDKIELLDDVEVKEGVIINQFRLKGHFRWLQKSLDEEIQNNVFLIVKSDKFSIRYCRVGDRIVMPTTEISKKDNVGTNETASSELRKIFNEQREKVFDFNKPADLISYLIKLVTTSPNTNTNSEFIIPNSSLVLDFFAGSGTTGQAVMELNEEDGGKRKFILVTNNENGIGEKITRERLYRIINGKSSGGEEIAWKYSDEKPCLQNNCVRVFGIETHELTLQDLSKAEKLKEQAKTEFKKLNPAYDNSNEFDVYNELAALNPIKN